MFFLTSFYVIITHYLIYLYLFYFSSKLVILGGLSITQVLKIYFISGYILSFYLYFISSTRVTRFLGYIVFCLLPLLVICFTFIKNVFFFLFIYEFFLFPSILIVYLFSPNIRLLAANLYFIMWTQFGSLLVILGCLLLYLKCGVITLNNLNSIIPDYISFLFILGLGVKIPIWPFHFWLTKTHVEAPTYFSIYLSGFLVKTAVLGFIIFLEYTSFLVIFTFIIISIVGVLDSTLKFAHQIDLKKLVAYTTVQEMNMILLIMFVGLNLYLPLVLLFIITHTILSSLFFYIVDVIYKNHLTRVSSAVFGVKQLNYVFGVFLLFSVFFYLGFPYTVKFFIEIKLFLILYNYNKFIFYTILFIVNWVGSVVFGKIWFNVIYLNPQKQLFYYLNKKEYIFFIFFLSIFIFFTIIFLYL